jgi:hypothetical protein
MFNGIVGTCPAVDPMRTFFNGVSAGVKPILPRRMLPWTAPNTTLLQPPLLTLVNNSIAKAANVTSQLAADLGTVLGCRTLNKVVGSMTDAVCGQVRAGTGDVCAHNESATPTTIRSSVTTSGAVRCCCPVCRGAVLERRAVVPHVLDHRALWRARRPPLPKADADAPVGPELRRRHES